MDASLLIPLGLALAAVIPLALVLWILSRSPRPARFRYRMMLVCGPLMIAIFAFLATARFLREGSHWTHILWIGLILLQVWTLWKQLPRLRLAAQQETPRGTKPGPKLLWPFAAILGPMLLLAGMAAWTLRADRRSVEQEAKARAAELAAAVSARLDEAFAAIEVSENGFTTKDPHNWFSVNERFELTYPPSRVWPPTPQPLTEQDFANLKPHKLEQWQAAAAAFDEGAWEDAARLYLEFLEGRTRLGTEPMADFHAGIASSRFRPIAIMRRAAALERLGDTNLAITAYNDVFGGFVLSQSGRAESGVPYVSLAILKILDLAHDQLGSLPEEWRNNPQFLVLELANNDPSPFGGQCIKRLRALAPQLTQTEGRNVSPDQLFSAWDRAERIRQFYTEAAACQAATKNGWPDVFWVNGTNRWLAVRQQVPEDGPSGHTPDQRFFYACLPDDWLARQIGAVWRQEDRRGDFMVHVEIAGEPVSLMWVPLWGEAGRAARPWKENDFTAHERVSDKPVVVTAGLANPKVFFDAVRRRQWILGLMLLLAVAAGGFAAIMLRNSLLKQLKLNEQKSNFVSSVSHELRAPIASVRLMAESLERGKIADPARQQEYFRLIGHESRRLSALIGNVLDFSRIEQGRKQYEFESTDLRKLVEETVRLMQPSAEEREVALKSEVRSPKSEMEVDGRAIQQALINLIDNAIKHSPKGRSVTVRLEHVAAVYDRRTKTENGERSQTAATTSICHLPSAICLRVEDHGPGIPASEHERIFERFHRLGSELRRETQGVGIGLSIVKHIVEAHSGRVRVESEVGKGSRFTIELPGTETANPR